MCCQPVNIPCFYQSLLITIPVKMMAYLLSCLMVYCTRPRLRVERSDFIESLGGCHHHYVIIWRLYFQVYAIMGTALMRMRVCCGFCWALWLVGFIFYIHCTDVGGGGLGCKNEVVMGGIGWVWHFLKKYRPIIFSQGDEGQPSTFYYLLSLP